VRRASAHSTTAASAAPLVAVGRFGRGDSFSAATTDAIHTQMTCLS